MQYSLAQKVSANNKYKINAWHLNDKRFSLNNLTIIFLKANNSANDIINIKQQAYLYLHNCINRLSRRQKRQLGYAAACEDSSIDEITSG